MRLYSKSASCNWDTKAIDIAAFPFLKNSYYNSDTWPKSIQLAVK